MGLKRLKRFEEEGLTQFQKIVLSLFVILYPMFVSMYPLLPPFIGLAGYFLLIYLEKENMYVLAPLFYLLNLDFNLSLPILLSIFIITLIYLFVYTPLKRLVRCKVCLLFMLIVLIDFSYYFSLFIYDFIFSSSTVLADMFLVYYILFDILMAVLL
jgi:hypothetical protein